MAPLGPWGALGTLAALGSFRACWGIRNRLLQLVEEQKKHPKDFLTPSAGQNRTLGKSVPIAEKVAPNRTLLERDPVYGVLKITTERKENAYRAFNEKTKKFYNDKKYVLHFDLMKTLVEYLTKFKEGLPSNIISLS